MLFRSPAVNDESYINQYYHYNPPTRVVLLNEYKFNVSDKSGIGETRNTKLNIDSLLIDMMLNKDMPYTILNGRVKVL